MKGVRRSRAASVRAGLLLGWLSVAAVLIAVVLGLPVTP